MRTNTRRRVVLICTMLALVVLAGCAAGSHTVSDSGQPAGFWWGLWHGFIIPVTFIISLFNNTVNIYQTPNSGGWYDFGFVIGLSLAFSVLHGPRTAAVRSRQRRGPPRT